MVPALIRRFHEAKLTGTPEVVIWGTGRPLRELMHVDDLADALLLIMNRYDEAGMINVGSGQEVSIAELAALVAEVVGYSGSLRFDSLKPDGTPRKRLDTSRLDGLDWRSRIPLKRGLRETYEAYVTGGS